MVYVRIKKVKGKEYGYLVQSKWRKSKGQPKKSHKQKVKKYLGRVYRLDKERDIEFSDIIDNDFETYLKRATKQSILKDLIMLEIVKCGFNLDSDNKRWVKRGVVVDIVLY